MQLNIALEDILSKAANGEHFEDSLTLVKTHYDGDFDVLALRGQLQLMKSEFKLIDDDLRDGELWTWRDVVECVKELRGPQKQLLSEVVKLIRLLLLIPATNAVSERSASAVRRTKTYL